MKTVFKRLAGVAAVAALAMPTIAQANPAASLSLSPSVRASATTANSSKIGKSTLLNLGIFAVLVAVIVVATTTGGDDKPDSP